MAHQCSKPDPELPRDYISKPQGLAAQMSVWSRTEPK